MRFLLMTFVLLFFIQVVPAIPSMHAPEKEVQQEPFFQTPEFLKPIKKVITKWSIVINREIPKQMKKLKDEMSPLVVLMSAGLAFLYGAVHTLGPGHGKMVVASYFLTHGAKIGRGVWVGAQVALAHVGGAVLLVLLADIAMKHILTSPEAQVYWVKSVSYGLIVLIGSVMLIQSFRHILSAKNAGHSCVHCSHGHNHDEKPRTVKETALAWAIGAVPCTGSLLILLYAMAHDVMWLGLFMVFCVAAGMAMAMTMIGLICISGKKHVLDRFSESGKSAHTFKVLLEIGGALMIMFIGTVLLLSIVGG